MERNIRKTENINKDKDKNKKTSLKARKKSKGYCRFLRNVIKEKAKVMKEVIQNRFFKWRRDALKGKVKKTVMIRISVSREKDPKSSYQLNKAKLKEQSKSVNKNDFKSFNINNIAKNITNLKVQNIDKIEMQDKRINDIKNKNIVNKNIVDIKNKKEPEKIKEQKNNIEKPDLQNKINDKGKINNKIEIPKVVPKNDKMNQAKSPNIPKPNQNIVIKNPQNVNKPNIANNSNIYVYTSSSKRNNTNPVKNIKDVVDKNNNNKNVQSDTKDKIPKDLYKKYEKYNQHTSLPVKKVEIDLTDGKYKRKTFNRENKDNNLKNNLSHDRNKPQNIYIYNNNSYQRRNNANNDNKSLYNYSVKTENYNNDSSSIYTRSRKDSNFSYVPNQMRNSSKGGITTVIQHYSGQRRKYDNYDNNNLEANKNKK